MRIRNPLAVVVSPSLVMTLALAVSANLLLPAAGHAAERDSTTKIGHSHCCGKQDVILIRGGAGYWPGAGALASHLNSLGYAATVTDHWQYGETAEKIIAAVHEGRMSNGVVIVGYSTGADAACWMAEKLNERGVRVHTMVLIESTWGTQVPSNVDYCVNYYEPRKFSKIPVFRGVPVMTSSPQSTLYNINIAHDPYLSSLQHLNHFQLPNHPNMHGTIGGVLASRISPSTRSYQVDYTPKPVMYADGIRQPERTADSTRFLPSKIR